MEIISAATLMFLGNNILQFLQLSQHALSISGGVDWPPWSAGWACCWWLWPSRCC